MPVPLDLHDIPGFRVAAVASGIKESGDLDLGLIVADEPAVAAALFTQNEVTAAPVKVSRASLEKCRGHARAVLVGAGNANCCTGAQGRMDAESSARTLARLIGCRPEEVLLANTGVIGQMLPMDRVLAGIESAVHRLDSRKADEKAFAEAIRTLDTHAKTASTTLKLGGKTVRIAGAAKGIGMCAPNMATVLVFLLTDAVIVRPTLEAILKNVVAETFNVTTVDGDTSTNDTCLMMASGMAANAPLNRMASPEGERFAGALAEVCDTLARMLAADGEGASKFVTVRVTGAKSRADAELAARTIAESPLVKTAIHGADPNWGRVLMAAGRSGARVKEEKCRLSIAGHELFSGERPAEVDPKAVSKAMQGPEVTVELDLGLGRGESRIYTCDLTRDYITINADYHT